MGYRKRSLVWNTLMIYNQPNHRSWWVAYYSNFDGFKFRFYTEFFYITILFIKILGSKNQKNKNYQNYSGSHTIGPKNTSHEGFFLSNEHSVFFNIFKIRCCISGSVKADRWGWHYWHDPGLWVWVYSVILCLKNPSQKILWKLLCSL